MRLIRGKLVAWHNEDGYRRAGRVIEDQYGGCFVETDGRERFPGEGEVFATGPHVAALTDAIRAHLPCDRCSATRVMRLRFVIRHDGAGTVTTELQAQNDPDILAWGRVNAARLEVVRGRSHWPSKITPTTLGHLAASFASEFGREFDGRPNCIVTVAEEP